jgi:hypothetical protein
VTGPREQESSAGSFLSRLLVRRRVRFVCLAFLLMSLALLAVSFATADGGQTAFGSSLGADYAGFYSAATIANTAPDRLYDFDLQNRIHHSVLPREQGLLPYFHPPFVALALRPLALLPYPWSFAAWLVLSTGLYLAGLALALRSLPRLSAADWPLVFLLALSFEPFLMECWVGGQLSSFGFFSVALAVYCFSTHRPWSAGAALGLCLYKPTWLVLLLPMLVVSRNGRALAGFGLTALALAGVSLAAVGTPTCLDYTRILLGFARTTTSSEGAAFQSAKYVDLNFVFRLLFGGPSPLTWVLLLLLLAPPLASLAVAWWKLPRSGADCRRVVWAATLTWTLLANLYIGVYDSVLVVLSALLTAEVLLQPGRGASRFRGSILPVLLLLLYLSPWVSQHLARLLGLQVYSFVLLALGAYQLLLARDLAARPTAGPPTATGDRTHHAL